MMINSEKLMGRMESKGTLLSEKSISNMGVIRRRLVDIDGMLKDKLVLAKVREGIRRQEEERLRRVEREDDIEDRDDDRDIDMDGGKRKRKKPKPGGPSNILGPAGAILTGAGIALIANNLGTFRVTAQVLKGIGSVAVSTFMGAATAINAGYKVVNAIETRTLQMFGDKGLRTLKQFQKVFSTFVNVAIVTAVTAGGVSVLGKTRRSLFPGRVKPSPKIRTKGFSIKRPLGVKDVRRSLSKRNVTTNLSGFGTIEQGRAGVPVFAGRDKIVRFIRGKQESKQSKQQTNFDINPETGREYTRFDPEIGMAPPEGESGRRVTTERGNVRATFAKDLENAEQLRKVFGVDGTNPNPKLLQEGLDEINAGRYKGFDDFLRRKTAEYSSDARKPRSIKKQRTITGSPPNQPLIRGSKTGRGFFNDNSRFNRIFESPLDDFGIGGGNTISGPSFFNQRPAPLTSRQILSQQGSFNAPKIINQVTKNADNFTNVKSLSTLLEAFGGIPLVKATRQFLGNTVGRIPLLGDLIGVLLDVFVFKQPIQKALFMAAGGALGGSIGAWLGGILGTVVPVVGNLAGAVVGGFLGGVGGDMLGGFLYDVLFAGKPGFPAATTQNPLEKTAKSTLKLGLSGGGLVPALLSMNNGGSVPDIGYSASYDKPGAGSVRFIPIPITSSSDTGSTTTSSGGVFVTKRKRSQPSLYAGGLIT